MGLHRIIYTSRPFGYDAGVLNAILADARRANERDDITGALICRDDIYLQWLEGPRDAVLASMERIKHDDRHVELKIHASQDVTQRVFGAWAMLHDPATSWIWPHRAVAAGAVDRATLDEIKTFFLKLRDKQTGAAIDQGLGG
jgi:hypothetical protein